MPKRKASQLAGLSINESVTPTVPPPAVKPKLARGRSSALKARQANPDFNSDVIDSTDAARASPSAIGRDEVFRGGRGKPKSAAGDSAEIESLPSLTKSVESESDLSELSDAPPSDAPTKGKNRDVHVPSKGSSRKDDSKASAREQFLDSEADEDAEAGEDEILEAVTRPPPVNSSVLPLPWKGRLGYACLNTYLRAANIPVFASRTCRIASILENRHPLLHPDQPPHPTKNRPDREQPASLERGQRFVESLGLANAKDCIKMLEWNDRYGIKFMRLSSEMFPFASHEEYGYKLAPFAADVLGELGKTAARLGHRLTTHPGQFTQLGSPRQVVIDNAIRDLDYHAELLSLLKMPSQQDRDAVMIIHLGGTFGDKAATIDRFRENYKNLSAGVKKRLVLENDDVNYSVHDLLPVCEELNIPMVLDFHHHNIIFDADKIREGTKDIINLFPRILATWKRKNITPKMHYSEQTPKAITRMQRRKHSPRVATLPPCPPDMDLMIEAKDKEQAVFELMRTFKLPGFESISDVIPHVRQDENKPVKVVKSKKKAEISEPTEPPPTVPDAEVAMGGPEGRVYWPPGMEEWLRPKKRVIVKKETNENPAKVEKQKPKVKKEAKPLAKSEPDDSSEG